MHNDYTPSERGFKSEKEKKKFCPECPYKAVKNREIKCHQLNHLYRDGYLKCRYCNYYLINTKGMKQHEVLHAVDKSYTVNNVGQTSKQSKNILNLRNIYTVQYRKEISCTAQDMHMHRTEHAHFS